MCLNSIGFAKYCLITVVVNVAAGMMLGPMLLGWIADVSSVRVALHFNAASLVLVVAYFGIVASETKQR